ncbi:four helix bundle protein [Stenotrophomonas sp. 278]|uniref:four helix bundle protein n=1 Tax=Stenotrophomonas sp. 278 TaxID=2479851 RepID=UPI000F66BC2A|nr:four helix bundle protein [Stenotrophomonas sp. 278]
MTSRFQPPPIIKASERLLVDIEKAVRAFPRYHRYAVGSDLRSKAMEVLTGAGRAWRDRASQARLVGELVWKVDELKQYLQVAQLLRAYSSFGQFWEVL